MNGLPIRTGHPNRRVGLLYWLGEHVASGHREVFAGEARVGVHHHHIGDLFNGLPPHRTTLSRVYTKPFEFRPRCGFARPPVDSAAGDQVEGRYTLSDARGGVVSRRHQDDAMSEADAPRTLGRGGEEHLRGRRMRVFLKEVVLHLPGIVNAQAVRQLDLIQRVLEEAELGAGLPGTRQLVLIEDPEFHGRFFTGPALHGRHAKEVAQYCASLPTSDQSRPPIRPPSTRGKISDLTAASPM